MKKPCRYLWLLGMLFLFSSCSTTLNVRGVGYQSLRDAKPVESAVVPDSAVVVMICSVDSDGGLSVVVQNKTDKIMTIDRTRSSFRNSDGNSYTFYDPNVTATSRSYTDGSHGGVGVNLGAVTGALGVGGGLGMALSGVNVSGGSSHFQTSGRSTYFIDQPKVAITPGGQIDMGRNFRITGVGSDFLRTLVVQSVGDMNNVFQPENSYVSCNIFISYSLDNGETYDNISMELYGNALLVGKVKKTGEVNAALRTVYLNKPDALYEPWYLMAFGDEYGVKVKNPLIYETAGGNNLSEQSAVYKEGTKNIFMTYK